MNTTINQTEQTTAQQLRTFIAEKRAQVAHLSKSADEAQEATFWTTDNLMDELEAIASAGLTVEFQNILDAAEITRDDDANPFEDDEFYGHELKDGNSAQSDARARIFTGREGYRLIAPCDPDAGNFACYRKAGASKQVAREMVAVQTARQIDAIKKVYEDGPDYWFISIDFKGEHQSLGAIDGEEYARGECLEEVALEVVAQLESEGYTVNGVPLKLYPSIALKEQRANCIKTNRNAQNWTGDDQTSRAIYRHKQKRAAK